MNGEKIMTNYIITNNNTYNSREISFDGKPSEEVRTALKTLKMRWNPARCIWYGFAEESDIVAAILAADGEKPIEEASNVYTDGYLGGGAVYGSKSNQHLYGADLSKAIREDIKKAGIKGVTVRYKSYSGGQSITATVSLPESAFVPEADFISNYKITPKQTWIYYLDNFGETKYIHFDNFFESDAIAQERIRVSAAKYEYDIETRHECQINHFYLESYKIFTTETQQKLEKIISIISAYRYDESNSMVDYFDTNFYFTVNTKPIK